MTKRYPPKNPFEGVSWRATRKRDSTGEGQRTFKSAGRSPVGFGSLFVSVVLIIHNYLRRRRIIWRHLIFCSTFFSTKKFQKGCHIRENDALNYFFVFVSAPHLSNKDNFRDTIGDIHLWNGDTDGDIIGDIFVANGDISNDVIGKNTYNKDPKLEKQANKKGKAGDATSSAAPRHLPLRGKAWNEMRITS